MAVNKIEEAKKQLNEELKSLEELEKKVNSKKKSLEYKSKKVPFEVGQAFFFRTVTYHATGRVKAIVGDFLILEDAAWIADSGRFHEAITDGTLNEIEPVEEMFLNINSIVDAFPWLHSLPRTQK